MPSPFRSAAATETGLDARGVVDLGGEGAVAVVEQHAHGVAAVVRDGEVGLAVAVQVRRRDRRGARCPWGSRPWRRSRAPRCTGGRTPRRRSSAPPPQATGVPPAQTPAWQVLPMRHASPSRQAVPSATGTWTGTPSSHTSSVQGLPSSTGTHAAPPAPPPPPVLGVVPPTPPVPLGPAPVVLRVTSSVDLRPHPSGPASDPSTSEETASRRAPASIPGRRRSSSGEIAHG